MTRFLLPVLIFISACNNSSSKKETVEVDSPKTTVTTPDTNKVVTSVGNIAKVNEIVRDLSDGMWHIVTDAESGWMPDVFDYFVKPERVKNPDYPYVATGDFNCDNKPDYAAVVTDSAKKNTYIVFVSEGDTKLTVWGEDVQGVAIASLPASEVRGFVGEKEKTVMLKCNGLNAMWFESSSYVIYWNGKKFENVWTSD